MWNRPIVVVSAVLLAVVLVAGVIVAVVGAPNPAPVSPSAASTDPDSSSSKCGIADGDQSVPTSRAPEASWELVGRIAAPSNRAVGPGLIASDGLRSCFAHSPTGALFAATTIVAQGSTPALALRNAQNNFAAGPGRDIVVSQLREARADTAPGAAQVSAQIAGFQVLKYEGRTATVDLAVTRSNGVVLSAVIDLVWQDGDWKCVLQDNGQARVPIRQIPSLAGYVFWSGA